MTFSDLPPEIAAAAAKANPNKPTRLEPSADNPVLCRLSEIADPGAKGFVIADEDGFDLKVFVVRQGPAVHGYINSCPHNRIPLDFKPNDFLDLDRSFIQCATHGALFQIRDGLCIEGPCLGRSLDPYPVVSDGVEVSAKQFFG